MTRPALCSLIAMAAVLAPPVLMAGVASVEIARESFEGTAGSIGFTTSVPQYLEEVSNRIGVEHIHG